MMDDPATASTARRPARWWQFGLRGLLALVLLVALGLLACREYLKPYWRQQQTARLIEQLGGTCHTAEAGQWWLQLLGSTHNVTQVNLADCDDPDAYVAQVTVLPAVELLIVGGLAFTDEHARQLHRMQSLRGVILDSTSVSDEGIAALRQALNHVVVYVSQRRAISHFDMALLFDFEELHPLQDMAGDDELFDEAKMVCINGEFRDQDAAYLRVLRRLEALQITRITDEGLKQLPLHLRRLYVRDTDITDAGLEHLTRLRELRELHFGWYARHGRRGGRSPAGVAEVSGSLAGRMTAVIGLRPCCRKRISRSRHRPAWRTGFQAKRA